MGGCQPDEEHLKAEPYQVLESILSTHDITFKETVDVLMEEMRVTEEQVAPYRKKLELATLRARNYKAHVITYHTVDPNGQPVIASGVVYYPKTGKPKGVIEALSYNKNKFHCPSKQLINLQLLQGMAGYVVLVSDMIGCGATESMVIPYLYHDNVAQVSADLRRAATELVRNVYGKSMPSWTLISGLSLAASEAWALARHYHQHPELGVQVNQIWMSGGVYYPRMCLEQQLRTRYSKYALLPNAIYSANYYDRLGINLRDVFRGELSQHYEEWCTGEVALKDLTEWLGTDLNQYLHLDFFSYDQPAFLKFLECTERHTTPNDWVPTCPVHIYHGRNDVFVPIECADSLANYLRSVGANVDYVVTDEGHEESGITMGADMAGHLYK